MHIWSGSHSREVGLPFRVHLAGSWRQYRRKVLWFGRHFVGVQGKRSPLPKI